MTEPTITRRALLRRLDVAIVVPATTTQTSQGVGDQPTAGDLAIEPEDIPWQFDAIELPTDERESPFLSRLAERVPRLADADTVLSRYASTDVFESPPPPDLEAAVVVPEGDGPKVEVIDELMHEFLDETYTDPLSRFNPQITETRSGGFKRWTCTLSVQNTTLRDVYTRQRVRDTLFMTNVRAYDEQHSAPAVADVINRRLRYRRLSRS